MNFLHAIAILSPCVILAATEIYLSKRAIGVELLALIPLCLFLSTGIARGSKAALTLTAFAALLWCLESLGLALHRQSIPLGFFTLFLAAYWLIALLLLRRALKSSSLDSNQSWYQGVPSFIPGLHCQWLNPNEEPLEFNVSRLDREGAFIFLKEKKNTPWNQKKGSPEMIFRFRNKEVRCKGKIVRILKDEGGAGLRFSGLSADAQKKLGDFVETLRGEGHAS